jgi:hypothetical protein
MSAAALTLPRAAPAPRPAALAPSPRPAPRLVPRFTAPVQPLPTRSGHGLKWSPDELGVLRERYPTGGALACLPFLPARELHSITAKANRMGMRFHAGYQRQPPSDDRTDALIRALYATGPAGQGAMRALCAQTQRPRQWLRWRAIQLGVIKHQRGPNWTPAEDAILTALEGKGPRAQQKALAAAGFTRTAPAVAERSRHLGLMAVEDRSELYSLNEVMALLGLTDHHVITRWLTRGDLKGRPEGPAGVVSRWRIRRADLRTFMIEHPMAWWPARCDRHWLIEILAGRVGPRVSHD